MSTPKGDSYVILFATIVCLVCSVFLSVAASTLKQKQDFNVEIFRKINVLKAFGVPVQDDSGKQIAPDTVEKYFTDHISMVTLDALTGQIVSVPGDAKEPMDLYLWKEGDTIQKYAFPISGKGLWSTIYGYLALEHDLATIAGITFYKHGETPGLGGEVEAEWFQTNFRGKKVVADGERIRFEIVKGKVADKYPDGNDHAVDGISGATITGNGVMRFMNAALDKYEGYFKLQRGI